MSSENLSVIGSFYLKSPLVEVSANGTYAISVVAIVLVSGLLLRHLARRRR
ncbi:hypothetical protein V1282_003913 [Nitrobacteraceae bacterium AZCC 2146]